MLDFDVCPHCGQKILKGAMRCTGCGKILKTREEQIASIRNHRESKKRFNVRGFLEIVIILCALGYLIYHFSDQISEFLRSILKK
jgi:uncharacterized membrane protein YvbJ